MRHILADVVGFLNRPVKPSDISGIVVMGDVRGDVGQFGKRKAKELTIPWTELQADQSELAWLDWRTRLSDFIGRDAEKDELIAWAKQKEPMILARFITGDSYSK